jgi:VTC domain
MNPLPTQDLRHNLATWAVPNHTLPALGSWMHDAAPNEVYDPHFRGQRLETVYFDTADFALRKARVKKDHYVTVRIRCYGVNDTYALSVKTERAKTRRELEGTIAELLIKNGWPYPDAYGVLPADIQARLLTLLQGEPLVPVVKVCCRRYAVEDETERFTLDTHIHTDTGKCLPCAVLEFKSSQQGAPLPGGLGALRLRPIKLSKFLWATEV